MKKVVITLAVILLAGISLQVASNHYRYELSDWALNAEAERSKLSSKQGQLDTGSFAYLEGPKVAEQQAIIMIHGFGASKENWLRFARYFTDQYHVIALDLAGHGANEQDMTRHYGIGDQVAYVHAVSKQLGLEQFHLVGNSMGGAISTLYAATHPDQVLSATLISPAGVHDIPSRMDELLEANPNENPLIAKTEDEFEDLMNFAMEQRPFIPAPILRVQAEKAVNRVEINKLIFGHIRAEMGEGLEDKVANIKAPFLIIWGDQDRAINVANIDKYAEVLPDASKLVLEGVGHLAMIEVPEVSANAMLEFIQR